MLAIAVPLARLKAELFYRPFTNVFLLHHFPALRTGLLSSGPSGTGPLRTLLNPKLTRMLAFA